jgi:hypothetical protein
MLLAFSSGRGAGSLNSEPTIGTTGTIGSAVTKELRERHDIIRMRMSEAMLEEGHGQTCRHTA